MDSIFTGIGFTTATHFAWADFGILSQDFRIGVIGLDTSHSPAFAKYINDPQNEHMKGMKVTAAYPYGSRNIQSSFERIPEYTEQFKSMGIRILDSIEALLGEVDGILLETNDGNPHYEQALQVMKAGKPLFIDKPVAGNLVDVIRIVEANKKYPVPMFSSSSLRFLQKAQEVRYNSPIGEITGADAFSPESWEPTHTDLYWYGIHGVEILYTIMGPGCRRLRRNLTEHTDLVVGEWEGGRIGTFRGDLHHGQYYGGTAYGTKGVVNVGSSEGYGPLIEKIAEFFRTGKAPVEIAETLEIYTFMEAADVSKNQEGGWVELKDVYDQCLAESTK
jgi:predicted dehydrogenase